MDKESVENLTEKIEKLASLHERGLLTDEEFSTAKKLVLGISNQEKEQTSKELPPRQDTTSNTNSGNTIYDIDIISLTEKEDEEIATNSVQKDQNVNTENYSDKLNVNV